MRRTPNARAPAGMALILLLIGLWAVLVATVADLLEGLPWPVHALYYAAAGIGWIWILPLKRLLRWMETGKWRE